MKRQKRNNSRYRGRRTGAGTKGLVLPVLAILILALAAVCRFVVPGMKFSAELLACAAAACLLTAALNHWAENSPAGAAVRRIFLVCLAAFAILFAAAESVIVYMGRAVPAAQSADAVIVLGAGVNGETPSPVLQSRIDAAASYLKAHPQTTAVLSGGKSGGESVSEAQAMRSGLTERGISANRLYLEKKSENTSENIRYSQKLLKENGVNTKKQSVAVVTSDFHICRARFLAKEDGMRAVGVPAKTPHGWLSAKEYAREVFALGDAALLKLV